MLKLHAAFAGAAALAFAGSAIAAGPVWNTTRVDLPDGSQAEIEYVGDIPPKVRVSMPVVQDVDAAARNAASQDITSGEITSGEITSGAVTSGEAVYGGLPRARRVVQPQPAPGLQAAPQAAPPPPPPPQFVVAGDAPKGSTYEYTLITTGADGKVCSQRTEWKSRGKGKEPQVTRTDHGEGCASLTAPTPAPSITPDAI